MKIRCLLRNASTEINGVAFEKQGNVMVSVDDVPEDKAEVFLSIRGYDAIDTSGSGEGDETPPAKTTDGEGDGEKAKSGGKKAKTKAKS